MQLSFRLNPNQASLYAVSPEFTKEKKNKRKMKIKYEMDIMELKRFFFLDSIPLIKLPQIQISNNIFIDRFDICVGSIFSVDTIDTYMCWW